LKGEGPNDWSDGSTEEVGLANGLVEVGWLVNGELVAELKDDMDVPVVELANIDCLNGFVDCTEEPFVVPVEKCC
jgi:hypothetical protein